MFQTEVRENQNKHFIFSNFFPRKCAICEIMCKYRAFRNVLRDYKNLRRKSVGYVFTKPVQIEGTNKSPPPPQPPSKLFFIVVHISAARLCECM